MSAKDHWTAPNPIKSKPISVRVKSYLINQATGPLAWQFVGWLQRAAISATCGWLASKATEFPLLQHVDPWELAGLVGGLVYGAIEAAMIKWTGVGARDLQKKARDAGVYTGRIDGWIGPDSKEAFVTMVNDPRITIRKAKPVTITEDQP